MVTGISRRIWIVAAVVIVSGITWLVLASGKPVGPGEGFISGNGRIEATEIDIATTLPGRVIEISVNEGDFVDAGQPLAQMQIDSLDAQKDEAQAHYRQTLAAVASAEAQVAVRRSDTIAASAVAGQRESELDTFRRRLARSELLSEKNALSGQELDDDRAGVRTSERALAASRAQIEAANAAVDAALPRSPERNPGLPRPKRPWRESSQIFETVS